MSDSRVSDETSPGTESSLDPRDGRGIDAATLERYLSDSCTPEERVGVEAWAARDPRHDAEITALRAFYARAAHPAAPHFDSRPAWQSVRMRTRVAPHPRNLPRTRRAPVPHAVPYAAAAAVALLALALGVAFGRRLGLSRGSAPTRDYVTAAGQRETVTLVDGTQLTLAPASRLEVPADYAVGHRTVRLDGEAFFTVVHDGAHPFAVRAGNVVATDVGTRFDVRAYTGDDAIRVAVAEGRVSVARSVTRVGAGRSRSVPTGAGDLATVTDTGIVVTHATDIASLVGWAEGRLTFRDAPLDSVVRELGRWYGVPFRLSDPTLVARHVTLTLSGETRAQAATALCDIVAAECRRDADGAFLIVPRPNR